MHFNTLQAWLDWQENYHPRVIDLGLERATMVYQALAIKPWKHVTITVAGTNGKGSCIAFLDAILRAAGYRVGTYTSPHFIKYNERIKIAGQEVSDDQICQAFERIEAVRNNISLSYFEFSTLAALDIFASAELDVQLLEVGLGGRLDAVNIVDSDVTIITSICIDHCDWLGATREAIGREKAGIYRSGVPAVIGDPEPPESLSQCALAEDVPLFCLGKAFHYNQKKDSWDWLSRQGNSKNYTDLPSPALQGDHQYANAATVIQALHVVDTLLPVTKEAIKQGLTQVQLSGRYQLIDGDVPVLLDVAHNPMAAQKLAEYVGQVFVGKKVHALFAMMKDKDFQSVIETMKVVVSDWYLSPLKNPRTADLAKVKSAFSRCAVHEVYSGFSDFTETYQVCRQRAKKGDIIIIFGSFFLVSEYLINRQTIVKCKHG